MASNSTLPKTFQICMGHQANNAYLVKHTELPFDKSFPSIFTDHPKYRIYNKCNDSQPVISYSNILTHKKDTFQSIILCMSAQVTAGFLPGLLLNPFSAYIRTFPAICQKRTFYEVSAYFKLDWTLWADIYGPLGKGKAPNGRTNLRPVDRGRGKGMAMNQRNASIFYFAINVRFLRVFGRLKEYGFITIFWIVLFWVNNV